MPDDVANTLTSCLLRISVSPRPLPQHILLYLPRARLRQFSHHLHLSWHHKSADVTMLLGPLDDFLSEGIAVGSVLSGDKGLGTLTPVRICDGTDADFEDLRVRGQHGFECY